VVSLGGRTFIRIFQGDCLDILAALPENSIDLIFADPPYFLSKNGITCHAGRKQNDILDQKN
jgi:DNA modification methylase